METYLNSQSLLNEFVAFASGKDMQPNQRQIHVSEKILLHQLKSYIVRNTLGDRSFFEMINHNDVTVKKALEEVRKL